MACKGSAVRSRLAPPSIKAGTPASFFCPSRPHRLDGLGHRPFKAATRVRIPLGTPNKTMGYVFKRDSYGKYTENLQQGKYTLSTCPIVTEAGSSVHAHPINSRG